MTVIKIIFWYQRCGLSDISIPLLQITVLPPPERPPSCALTAVLPSNRFPFCRASCHSFQSCAILKYIKALSEKNSVPTRPGSSHFNK